jgi:hypothetical protein
MAGNFAAATAFPYHSPLVFIFFNAPMASLADFDFQVATIADANELVGVFKAATCDSIYDELQGHFAENFRNLIHGNCGVFQVARLKRDTAPSQIAGLALFKLHYGGSRGPETKFAATLQQRNIHAKIFGSQLLVRDFSGDPVLNQFKASLQASGQTFHEFDEDVLSKDLTLELCAEQVLSTYIHSSSPRSHLHLAPVSTNRRPPARTHQANNEARYRKQHQGSCI